MEIKKVNFHGISTGAILGQFYNTAAEYGGTVEHLFRVIANAKTNVTWSRNGLMGSCIAFDGLVKPDNE